MGVNTGFTPPQTTGVEATLCDWVYTAAASAGPYQYNFWVGVTGTSADVQLTPFRLVIRLGGGGLLKTQVGWGLGCRAEQGGRGQGEVDVCYCLAMLGD